MLASNPSFLFQILSHSFGGGCKTKYRKESLGLRLGRQAKVPKCSEIAIMGIRGFHDKVVQIK